MTTVETRAKRFQTVWLTVAGLFAALVAGVLLFALHEADARRDESIKIRLAFCQEIETVKLAQAADVTRRLVSSRAYLEANPQGAPGIPPALIREGIRNAEQTLRDLRPIRCEDFAEARNINLKE